MGTETWIISLPLSDSVLYLKIIHPPNFREEPFFIPHLMPRRHIFLKSIGICYRIYMEDILYVKRGYL